jgi:hypothetical protein
MPSLASGHRRRCDLTIDKRRLYRSCHCAGPSYMSRRASCAHSARCPSLASGRRRCCALAVHIRRLQYRSCHRAGQSVKSRCAVCAHGRSVKSRRARCALMVLDALFGIRPPPSLSSRRPHRTFVPLLPSCRAIVQVEMRSLCAHRSRCPLWRRTAAPSLCSRRPHWTFVYRSRHRARRPSSQDALDMLMVLDALFCVGPAVADLSRRPPLGRLYRSCHRTERSVKSRRARCALMVLDVLFGIRPPLPLSSRRPHRTFVYRSCHRVQSNSSSRDALIVSSWFSMPSLASDRHAIAVLSPSTLDVCIPLSPSRKATVKSRCAQCAHGSRCPLLRRTRRR